MSAFAARRVSHEYTQTNDAPPEKVFPLLCPVREADWVPGWQYRLIYSDSGCAEDGCVFATPNDTGPETIWMASARITPAMPELDVSSLRIISCTCSARLREVGAGVTSVTGCSATG